MRGKKRPRRLIELNTDGNVNGRCLHVKATQNLDGVRRAAEDPDAPESVRSSARQEPPNGSAETTPSRCCETPRRGRPVGARRDLHRLIRGIRSRGSHHSRGDDERWGLTLESSLVAIGRVTATGGVRRR